MAIFWRAAVIAQYFVSQSTYSRKQKTFICVDSMNETFENQPELSIMIELAHNIFAATRAWETAKEVVQRLYERS